MSGSERPGILRRIGRSLDITRRVILNVVFFVLLAAVLMVLFPSDDLPEVDSGVALVVKPEGLLVTQHTGSVVERAMDRATGQGRPETLVRDVVRSIELAIEDERIEALVLDLDNLLGGGMTKLQTIADALARFRETDRPIYALGDSYSQPQYYLASQADEILMHPRGQVMLTGFSAYRNYYKGAIDMLDAEWNIFRVGEYKSFVEPYTRTDMSDEDREARLAYMNTLWDAWLADVAGRRDLDPETIQSHINNVDSRLADVEGDMAALSVEAGLVDELMYRDRMDDRVAGTVGENEDTGKFRRIGMRDYLAAQNGREKSRNGGQIAIIPAVGPIMDGVHPPGTVGGDSTASLIRDARRDDDVKAVVLQVDSPGGSAFASDVILRELKLVQEAGKPVVVSMGTVAASGGYWISMAADEIWAHPTTITGSIGILGMFPTFEETLAKIGITTDGVGTTELAGAFRVDRSMDEQVQRAFQLSIENGYQAFISKVAENREMSLSEVDAVARGRVWSGEDAHRIGLVDQLGDLDEAIASAAEMADLDEWYTRRREQTSNWRERFIANLLGGPVAGIMGDAAERHLNQAPHRRLIENLRRDLEQLDTFNDPNNLYYYCGRCQIQQ